MRHLPRLFSERKTQWLSAAFPLGKVNFLPLYPMTFHEFLIALGKKELVQLLKMQNWALITAMKSSYIDLLRRYYFIGGMPETVKTFVET